MKVVLLMGGHSAERDVSLMSGKQINVALTNLKHDVTVIDPKLQPDWIAQLATQQPDLAFNILHGGAGENGEVRAVLNALDIVSTGSDVLGCGVAMYKPLTKTIWRELGIPTANWRIAKHATDAQHILNELALPLFVKPASGGSSTHSSKVIHADTLPTAIEKAASETGTALIESLIVGDEYTLSILNNKPLPIIKIEAQNEFYDYHAKYIAKNTDFKCPCGLPAEQEASLTKQGLQAFLAVQCSEWGRVDFILSNDNKPYFLEVNTLPGMTSHSLVPMAANTIGVNFDQLVQSIMETALCKK